MNQLAQTIVEYQPHLHSLAMRLLGNHADAEDAVQDALIRAHKNFDQFRGEARLSTWLGSIVRNSALMQLRTRRAHLSLDETNEDGFGIADRLADEGPSAEEKLIAAQSEEQLEAALARLSPILRHVLTLRYVCDLSIKEAAALLEIPEGTVKARSSRAIAKLVQVLRREQA